MQNHKTQELQSEVEPSEESAAATPTEVESIEGNISKLAGEEEFFAQGRIQKLLSRRQNSVMKEKWDHYFGCRPKWCPSSASILKKAEEKILLSLKTPYNARYIELGLITSGKKESKIWTLSLNESSKEIPFVLLHGFGAGVGFWALNMVQLSRTRPVHAIDLLGFARSSRPKFSSDPEKAESEMIGSIEAWRIAMKLDKIILVGHSFGGYLSTSYSLSYPDAVCHLILADPWGFQEKPADIFSAPRFANVPWQIKMLVRVVEPLAINPFSALRLAGNSFGPRLIQTQRADLIAKFENFVEDCHDTMPKYIYHCNSQTPSGETVFNSLQSTFGWAKFPMRFRYQALDENIPLTVIYGSHSWVDHYPVKNMQEERPSSYVEGHVLTGGHHVYADNVDGFNEILIDACKHLKTTTK